MNASEKLLLISQSQEDADYLLDEKRSCKYIIRTFVLWTIELSIYSALSYIIHQINVFLWMVQLSLLLPFLQYRKNYF